MVSFLRLLCEVFELDLGRARSVFFSDPMYDITQRWGVFQDRQLVSILSAVPLRFGWGVSLGIAGVATHPEQRGKGLAADLIQRALETNQKAGIESTLLFAKDERLYSSLGFKTIDRSIRAPFQGVEIDNRAPVVSFEKIQRDYDAWAAADPNRLVRDARRWKLWKWNLRISWQCGDGYLCNEGDVVRELMYTEPPKPWPLLETSVFVGLESMAKLLSAPIGTAELDSYLMSRNLAHHPQFFLTDQF